MLTRSSISESNMTQHDEQSHNNSHLAFRYNPVEDSRFRQHVLIYTMMEVYPYCKTLEFKGETKGMFCVPLKNLNCLNSENHRAIKNFAC
ncbi:hypothetical protein TNCV_2053421 [Trichonephila clavipes]|nr:hypothetical protein TNCV_2053421 [Trichonephila clavipes]